MSILTSQDLKVIFDLVTRSTMLVSSVPQTWPTIQRLELASQSGVDYAQVVKVPVEAAEVDGNR